MSTSSILPTWPLISTKFLELRRRRGIMITAFVLILALPILLFGIRAIIHAVSPATTGPAGSPGTFGPLVAQMADLSFIAAAVIGANAGTTDLSDGVFRHLVITGRSRLALYFARIPAALAIVTTLVAMAFAIVCLVTAFAGSPNPTTIALGPINVPTNLSPSQFSSYVFFHSVEFDEFDHAGPPGTTLTLPQAIQVADNLYPRYAANNATQTNPPINEMIKAGLWFEFDAAMGCIVGLGFGALVGQRTVSTIFLLVFQIILTPIAALLQIPDFIDGQRLVIGVAIDRLKPLVLQPIMGGGGGGGGQGGGGSHGVAVTGMTHWFMIVVLAGWMVGWTAIGAWRMATRDA